MKVLLTSGVHQNYSYYDCKAGYLAPHEDCNIAHIDLPKTYPVAKSAIDELPDPHCVYKCIEAEACIVAPPECPVPPICPPCETTVCAKGQKACGTTPDENELCPPDEVCIPEDCECKFLCLNIYRRPAFCLHLLFTYRIRQFIIQLQVEKQEKTENFVRCFVQ